MRWSYWTIEYLSLRPQANEVDHPEHKPFTVQATSLTPKEQYRAETESPPAAKISIGYLGEEEGQDACTGELKQQR